jgi:hypothetical protein
VRQKNHGRKITVEKVGQKNCGRKSAAKKVQNKIHGKKIAAEKVQQKNQCEEKVQQQHGWGLFMRDMTHLVSDMFCELGFSS